MFHAVEQGRILHKTKNIKDSGYLLESRFREIIGSRLPQHIQLAHGYLFDINSKCTPQIDAMLLRTADNHPMMLTDGNAVYAPFTSCKVHIEVKSSIDNFKDQLKQINNISEAITDMQISLKQNQPDICNNDKIISVLFFVKSENVNIKNLITAYTQSPRKPTLLIFLDKAKIIAQRSPLSQFMEENEDHTINFEEALAGSDPWIYRAQSNNVIEARGQILIWLYYFLLYCMTERELQKIMKERSNDIGVSQIPPVKAFINSANLKFPLISLQSLSDITSL